MQSLEEVKLLTRIFQVIFYNRGRHVQVSVNKILDIQCLLCTEDLPLISLPRNRILHRPRENGITCQFYKVVEKNILPFSIIYRKADSVEVYFFTILHYFLRFNLSHAIKGSAHTFFSAEKDVIKILLK